MLERVWMIVSLGYDQVISYSRDISTLKSANFKDMGYSGIFYIIHSETAMLCNEIKKKERKEKK
jgi:hypothetical protein